MQTVTDTTDKKPEVITDNDKNDNKLKAHIVRRNIEDYLEQKALKRRLTEVIDEELEELNLGW